MNIFFCCSNEPTTYQPLASDHGQPNYQSTSQPSTQPVAPPHIEVAKQVAISIKEQLPSQPKAQEHKEPKKVTFNVLEDQKGILKKKFQSPKMEAKPETPKSPNEQPTELSTPITEVQPTDESSIIKKLTFVEDEIIPTNQEADLQTPPRTPSKPSSSSSAYASPFSDTEVAQKRYQYFDATSSPYKGK
jgi:hypothetical protein